MYKTVDLFAGIGGIRRGFEITGKFTNSISAETDQYACKTYKHIFGSNPYNDVKSEEFKTKLENINYDVLLAGFPCQSFSRAGKKKGFLDLTRGTLFFEIADILKRTRPKAFLLENVENLFSHDKGNTFKIILEVLINELNYHIVGVSRNNNGELIYERKNLIRNSKNFGIPQNRSRIYIIGFNFCNYGDSLKLLQNLHMPSMRVKEKIYKDLNSLLEYKAEEKYYLAEGFWETLKKHKSRHKAKGNGFGNFIVNDKKIKEPISNAILATGGSGKERNLVYDYQPDVIGKELKNKKTPINEEHIRMMTPREWGKLQGFIGYGFINENGRDLFSFPPGVSNTQLYKQFGNSVTIPVIEELAYFIYEILEQLKPKSKSK